VQIKIGRCYNLEECYEFFKKLEDDSEQLVQIITPESEAVNKKIIEKFNLLLPLSELIGVTAGEGIINSDITEQTIIITAVRFEESSFELIQRDSSSDLNAEIIAQNIQQNTKAVIVLSDNKYTDGDNFVNIFNKYAENIILAGGLAGFATKDGQSYIFDKNGIIKSGSIGIILNGNKLRADWTFSMGWESISREMEITKAEDRVIYELDGRSIFKVYSEFLGENIKNKLPSAAVNKFPLVLSGNFKNARSAMEVVNDGIRFSGNLKEGDKVKIAYGSLNKILRNAVYLRNNLNFFPEIAFVYSCSGRSDYLKSLNSSLSTELQVIPCQNTGFCTSGEYGTITFKAQFLNITTTVLYLSESDELIDRKLDFKTEIPEVKTEHLFHLSKKVISELEMINQKMRKANQSIGDKKISLTAETIFKMLFNDKKYTGGIVIKEAENLTNIYLDDSLGKQGYDIFRTFWNMNISEIKIKNNVLGFKQAFLIPLKKEVEALIIILSDEIDLYDIKKNDLFIQQIPNYLKKSLLYESLERNLASLSTLEQTSDFLYSTLDLELLYERILDIIVGTMGMSAAIIFKKEETELKSVKNINVPKNSELFYYLKGHFKNISLSEKIIIANNIDFKKNIETLIAIPISLNNYQGVLYAIQSKYKQLINENQKKFIRTLANQIRVSIRNALNHNKVKRLSVTDGLTDLYNHSYFHKELKKKDGEEYSVAIMDIDNFKEFNDFYGHQVGDRVLQKLSKLLKNEIREDDIVARYGGEEFVIYFNIVQERLLSKIINRLMRKIRELEINFENKKLKVTVSLGVAINKNGEYSSEKLIKQADTALYIAKGAGKDMVKFYRST
jgi:diguanylate cyclase (GGDEF)-like protein